MRKTERGARGEKEQFRGKQKEQESEKMSLRGMCGTIQSSDISGSLYNNSGYMLLYWSYQCLIHLLYTICNISPIVNLLLTFKHTVTIHF